MLKPGRTSALFKLLYAVKETLMERLLGWEELAGAGKVVLIKSCRDERAVQILERIRSVSPGCRITLLCSRVPAEGLFEGYKNIDLKVVSGDKGFNLINTLQFSAELNRAEAVIFPYNNLRRRGYMNIELMAALSEARHKGGVLADGRMIEIDFLTPLRKAVCGLFK